MPFLCPYLEENVETAAVRQTEAGAEWRFDECDDFGTSLAQLVDMIDGVLNRTDRISSISN